MKEKLETIKTLDMEIVDLINDEAELTGEIKRADGCKETIFSALVRADMLLDTPNIYATPITTSVMPQVTKAKDTDQ